MSNSDAPVSQLADFNSTVNADFGWSSSQVSTIDPERIFADLDVSGFFAPPVEDGFAISDYTHTFSVAAATDFILSGRGLITLTGLGGVVFTENSNFDNVEDPYISVPFIVYGNLGAGQYTIEANARTVQAVSFAGGDVEFELIVPEPASGAVAAIALASLMLRRTRNGKRVWPICRWWQAGMSAPPW